MFYSCDGVDFGPVRAYGAIPPIGPVGPIGPSRSRSHGRLRRSKSTHHNYLSPLSSFLRFLVNDMMLLICFFVTI